MRVGRKSMVVDMGKAMSARREAMRAIRRKNLLELGLDGDWGEVILV